MNRGADVDGRAAELDVVFRQQAKPVPARHRVAYRSAALVLVLSRFNQGAAAIPHLHTVMWSLRSPRTRQMFSAWWRGRRFAFTSTERIDPDLQVTLNLAVVDGLVTPTGKGRRVRLTGKGEALAARIEDEPELLTVEKAYLDGLGKLTDAAMKRLQEGDVR